VPKIFYGCQSWKYLKTGDEVGNLCSFCGGSLFIDKTNKRWTIRCYCGRVLPFCLHITERGETENLHRDEENMVNTVFL